MDDTHLLISLSNCQGQNFILKLSVTADILKILVTDKSTAEKWKCAFDSMYIENLSRKTGNFKQFKVFVSMLKAGLMKTNECVYVELVSQDELEARRRKGPKMHSNPSVKNRKYLILVYQVEFDKIHYPLPLEYCGRPSPDILQANVRKLENEVLMLKNELVKERMKNKQEICSREEELQNLLEKLNCENARLYDEISRLTSLVEQKPGRGRQDEENRRKERLAFLDRIYKLEIENRKLSSLISGRGLLSREPPLRNSLSRTRKSRSLERKSISLESLLSLIGSKEPIARNNTSSSLSSASIRKPKNRSRGNSSERHSSSEKIKPRTPVKKKK